MDYENEIKKLEEEIKGVKELKLKKEIEKQLIPSANISTEMLNKMKDGKIIIRPLHLFTFQTPIFTTKKI